MPEISVIIVNHNAAAYVRGAIASLRESTVRSYETIVMDNSTLPMEDCGADIHRPVENRGFGAACNQGAALAAGELLLFLNPDSELQPGSLDAVCHMLETEKNAGLVGLRTILPDGSFEPGCLRGFPTPERAAAYYLGLERIFPNSRLCGGYHMAWLDRSKNHEVDSVSGSFMLLRRSLFEELGGFDEDYFMYGEDMDLCWRVKEKGLRVLYCADGHMLHHHGKCGRSRRQTAAFYDSMTLFYEKHYRSQYPGAVYAAVCAAVSLMKKRALRKLEKTT